MNGIDTYHSNGLLVRLREATRPSHHALERQLNLVENIGDRAGVVRLLERFYGFHAVWEPAMASSPCGAFAASRARLSLLEADLRTLGRSTDQIAALALCTSARSLVSSHARAVGSLYVIEGSTLGGQLIGRALRRESWAPSGGSKYFNPYGKRTAAQWRAFTCWAEQQLDPAGDAHAAAAAAAVETFGMLYNWIGSTFERGIEAGGV